MSESPVCVTIAPLFASVITTIGVVSPVSARTSARVSFASFQLKASAGESFVSLPLCEISPLNTFSSCGKIEHALKTTTPATKDQSQIFFIFSYMLNKTLQLIAIFVRKSRG